MASFFTRMRSTAGTANTSTGTSPSKKDPNAPQGTPLERHLLDAGPLRDDGSDKFWGLENFGNTCYCNSILQCLYYSVPFREQIISYPRPTPAEAVINNSAGQTRLNTNAIILPVNHPSLSYSKLMNRQNAPNPSARNPGGPPINPKPEDKENPDFKKRVAQARGPTIAMNYENAAAYDMPESLFTALKDIFDALYAHQSRIGVMSPARFLEVLRRENEMFRTAMHQDAHEFLNILLNEIFSNIEVHSKNVNQGKQVQQLSNGSAEKTGFEQALASAMPESISNSPSSVQKLFEGTLTSETRCLTCENVSQRDEAFLDLSVDLDEHTSVTSCLRKFSEEEMLCERNKFHCDRCGGLQEAEKRMKIKRLPRILALHLKRFKYTEDLQRLQKLFHRVVYPFHLRLFNTTDDAEDPDRLYELYAVVVHIGGGPYHGHYVSIIKTEDRGWLLFDDEMVEPVDKSYVQNFFGDRPGLACAYVLFYQETTIDAVNREQDTESQALAAKAVIEVAKEPTTLGLKTNGFMNGIHHVKSAVISTPPDEGSEKLDRAISEPGPSVQAGQSHGDVTALPQMQTSALPTEETKSKKERAKEEKERKLATREAAKEEEKAERTRRKTLEIKRKDMVKKADAETKAAIEASKVSKVDEDQNQRQAAENINGFAASVASGGLGRFKSTSKSFKMKPRFFGGNSNKEEALPTGDENVAPSNPPTLPESTEKPQPKSKSPFSSLRKKTSSMML